MSDADQREEAVFEAALQRQGAERAAYLEAACAGNPALRQRIEGLLDALDRAGGLLSEPAVARDTHTEILPLNPAETFGDRIGRYKLLQQIGEGGCGVVYMAEQTEPVKRRVALKVLKLGMDTRQVIARFETERQALALMDHPNIAKVLDAGATETGRPYFVMELVRGVKITRFCDEQQLPMRQRLELFIQVCQAIQHAHQKGIIHRDIKPSNILVTINDGVAVPKVIDFGIAKATAGQTLTDKTLFTAFEQFIGTPAYMSPEQAVMTSLDVDTRSDIYSLGVLLYELLTGKTPFDTKELLAAGLDEMRRTIREKEPVRPSTRLNTLVEGELTTAANRRHTDPPKLIYQVRGDLDWIVMKCLEKDRARRYETANGLARDLERHLNCEPVVARPPSKLYEFRKTVCRHKFGFAAGATVILVLSLGVFASTRQALRAMRAEREQSQLRKRAEQSAQEARLAQSETTSNLWNSYLLQARANRFSGRPGRRFDSLAALAKAAAIRKAPELRDEAIAALALSDFRLLRRATNVASDLVVFDATLERYATSTSAGEIKVCATLDDREFVRLPAAERKIAALIRFSANGRHLAVRYADGSLKVWNLDTRRDIFSGRCAQDWGGAGADFSPDERLLAVANDRREVVIYDLATAEAVARHATPIPAVCVRYSFDGKLIAVMTRGETNVAVLDATSGKLVSCLNHSSRPYHLAWQPHGEWLAIAADKRVHLWNARTGEAVRILGGHIEELVSVEFVPHARLLASVGFDGLRLWDYRTGEQLLSMLSVGRISMSAQGDRMARVEWIGGSFDYYDLATGSPVRYLGSKEAEPEIADFGKQAAAFSPDGRWLAYAVGGDLKLFVDQHELASTNVGFANSVLFDVRSNLWVAGERGCSRWPLRAGSEAGEWTLGPPSRIGPDTPMQHTVVSPDGRIVAVCTGPTTHVFNAETGEQLSTLRGGTNTIVYAAVSPDGELIATCIWNARSIQVWKAREGTVQTNLVPPQWRGGWGAADVAFSPDGRSLLVSSLTPDTSLWGTQDWTMRWSRARTDLPSAAFSPDGSLVAVREAKRLVHLIAPETGETLAILEPPGFDHIQRMTFSPDGTQLAVCGVAARELVVWNLRGLRRELATLGLDWDLPPMREAVSLDTNRISVRFIAEPGASLAQPAHR